MAGWLCTIVVLILAGVAAPQDRWQDAERHIKRLPPSAFRELPRQIVRELEADGCTIPQLGEALVSDARSRNVVHGEFARKGQRDWAVLCSKGGQSTIRVFWGRPTTCSTEPRAAEDDFNYLQGWGGDTIVYSHSIQAVSERELRGWSGPPDPGVMKHKGISNTFEGKVAVVFYCNGEKWIEVASAD